MSATSGMFPMKTYSASRSKVKHTTHLLPSGQTELMTTQRILALDVYKVHLRAKPKSEENKSFTSDCMTTSGEVLYGEDYEAHPLFHIFFAAVIVLMTYLSMSPFNLRLPRSSQALVIFADVAVIFLYLNLRTLRIRVTERELRVAFGVIGTSVPLSDVLLVEAEKPSFWRYGGFGIRWGWDGSVGYLMNYGEAVRVIRRRGRAFVFSTHDPEAVIYAIESVMQG